MDGHCVNSSIVVPIGLKSLVIEIDSSTCVRNRDLAILTVCVGDGKLDTGWSLWKPVSICGCVESVCTIQSANDLTIDGPSERIRLPVEFISVEVVEGVLNGNVLPIASVYYSLRVVVGLSSIQISPNEFEVQLVSRVREQNELGDYSGPSRSLDCCCDSAVPDIMRSVDDCAKSPRGVGQQ